MAPPSSTSVSTTPGSQSPKGEEIPQLQQPTNSNSESKSQPSYKLDPNFSHHYNLDFGDRTTLSTFNYYKVLLSVKLMRAGTELGEPLGRLVGELEKLVKPDQVIKIKSSVTSKRKIKINIHRNNAAKMNPDKPTAVHLNWHGSGWFLPGLGTDASFIRQLLANPILADYPLTILDCDYAKSPEWPCPADVEDGRDAIEYVFAHPEKYDPKRVSLSGFSAGGSIALGLSVAMGKEAREAWEAQKAQETQAQENSESTSTPASASTPAFEHPIKAVFAVYPVATWQGPRETIKHSAASKGIPGMILPPWFSKVITTAHFFHPNPKKSRKMTTAQEERIRKEELMSRPIVSPACGENRDFSPIVGIYTAEFDHLTKRSEELRERLKTDKEGGRVNVQVYGETIKGVGHGWDQLVKKGQHGLKERDEAYDVAAQIIAKVGGVPVSI